jgi:hypothetical protein
MLTGLPATAELPAGPDGGTGAPADGDTGAGVAVAGEPGDPPAGGDAPADEATAGFVAEVTAGFRTILAIRELRLIVALYAAQTVVAGASMVYEVSIALELLDLGDSGVGLLDSMLGVGGLIGGFVAMVLVRRQRLATDFGLGVVLWSAPLLLVVASPTIPAALAAMFLIGVANSIVDINALTIVQRVTPSEVMGRVFGALDSAATAGMALGALVMPLLIETIGLRSGLAVVGTLVALVALSGVPGLVRIDRTVLAPPGLELLRRVPMLAALPAPSIERLAQRLVQVRVAPGETVFAEGDGGGPLLRDRAGRRPRRHRRDARP